MLIAAHGTEEGPCMPGNGTMKNSPFGVVYDQAISKKHFKLEDEEQIRLHLLKLAEDSQN